MQLVVWEENKHNPKGSQSEGEAKCIVCKFLLFKHQILTFTFLRVGSSVKSGMLLLLFIFWQLWCVSWLSHGVA